MADLNLIGNKNTSGPPDNLQITDGARNLSNPSSSESTPTQSEMSFNPLSYGAFLDSRDKFRRSGSRSGDEFNLYDTPSYKFFKIFFYFINGNDENESKALENSTGLLAPTWQLKAEWDNDDYWNYTSAWAFLKMNDENERAELLEKFIDLLSNINTYSPWYFKEVSGVDEAINRSKSYNSETGLKIPAERSKISIKCAPDAYDNRVSTLLELYKTIAFSWQLKKDILPANLRKFDMGIYVFEAPIKNMHGEVNGSYANIGKQNQEYITSYKYFEFHNCEIDASSNAAAYGSLKNDEGFSPEHTINIFYDDCYEKSYNEFLMRELGDVIAIDSVVHDYENLIGDPNVDSTKIQVDDPALQQILSNRSNLYSNMEIMMGREAIRKKGSTFLKNIINELVGRGERFLKSKIKKIYLGNLFSFSISRLKDQVKSFSQGHLWTTVSNVQGYTSKDLTKRGPISGNLFATEERKEQIVQLGNLYSAQSMANNI